MNYERRALALLLPLYERFIGRKAKPRTKNPVRVQAGKKAAETRRRNKEIAAALEKWDATIAATEQDAKL